MTRHSHYLLFSEASLAPNGPSWRFVLQDVESGRRFTVSDQEPIACGERLELLAVVRGLEAIDGPARVTLVTRSRYVSRGIRFGITEWRAGEWQWERFGRIVPVKDCDLWQRVDRALLFHQVDCQAWQFEDMAPVEPLKSRCSHVEVGPVEAVGSRCSEITPNPSQERQPKVVRRLAPIRRHAPLGTNELARRNRKRKIAPNRSVSPLGRLAAAVANRTSNWSESLRRLLDPARELAHGAA